VDVGCRAGADTGYGSVSVAGKEPGEGAGAFAIHGLHRPGGYAAHDGIISVVIPKHGYTE
jgi:hypothetical protein